MLGATWQCLLVALFLAVALPAPRQAGTAERLMGAARHLQDVEGKYAEAIAAYSKVLATPGVSRAIAAQAQLMMGVCYERLGRSEARTAYQAVLENFADQKEPAAEASRRLQALTTAETRTVGATLTQVPIALKPDMFGPPSPDGRFIVYRANQGDVFVEDLRTGQTRQLTHLDPSTVEMNDTGLLFSPDGGSVAYIWRTKDGAADELHVFDLKTSASKIVVKDESLSMLCWSPGGAVILFVGRGDNVSSVSLRDGTITTVMPLGGIETIGSFAFSPDGRRLAYDVKRRAAKGFDVSVLPPGGGTEVPVVGGEGIKTVCGWSPDGRFLYYTDDRSGTPDLFKAPFANDGSVGQPSLVHRDIGKMTAVGVTKDGTLYFSRDRNMVDVFTVDLDPQSGNPLSRPVHLDRSNVGHTSRPAWSPDGGSLAYHCAMRTAAYQPYVDSLCVKSLETGSVRRLKLDVSIYSALPITWSRDGRELQTKGITADKKTVTWRLAADTGQVLGQAVASAAVIRFPYDRQTRVTTVSRRDASGKETEIFRSEEGERASVLHQSADGRWLALHLYPAALPRNTGRVVVVAKDGSEHREVLAFKEPALLRVDGTVFSHDGRHIYCVMATQDVDSDEVWKIPVDGSPHQKLDLGKARVRSLAVRPDGKQLAFVVSQVHRPELWKLEDTGVVPPRRVVPVRKLEH